MNYCLSCHQTHGGDCCPPHEVRGGVSQSLHDAEAEIERLRCALQEVVTQCDLRREHYSGWAWGSIQNAKKALAGREES